MVFDASATTKSGQSLNSCIHTGPPMIKNMVGILMNFHLEKIGVIADLEKAFLV